MYRVLQQTMPSFWVMKFHWFIRGSKFNRKKCTWFYIVHFRTINMYLYLYWMNNYMFTFESAILSYKYSVMYYFDWLTSFLHMESSNAWGLH
jgi:hypothetical protein